MWTIPHFVAILAPLVNCVQLLPQLIKTYQKKSVKDLSLASIALFLTTNVLWFLHGYFIMDMSLMVAGCISIFINSSLLRLYFLYRRRPENKS